MKTMFLLIVFGMIFLLSLSISAVFAGGNDNVENLYFSLKIPDSWAYTESSNTPESKNTGFGSVNSIELTPNEFGDILDGHDIEKFRQGGSPFAQFIQDTDYPKNALLESYVKYQINNYGIQNITSQQYTTVGKEKAVRIDANESAFFGNTKTAKPAPSPTYSTLSEDPKYKDVKEKYNLSEEQLQILSTVNQEDNN